MRVCVHSITTTLIKPGIDLPVVARTGAPSLAGLLVLALLTAGCLAPGDPGAGSDVDPQDDPLLPEPRSYVVVATLDTGGNPFHDAFARTQPHHPSAFIPGYPQEAQPINLTKTPDFVDSVEASEAALEQIHEGAHPYYFPGTNIIGTWAHETDQIPIFDIEAVLAGSTGGSHSHGAQASSQIAGQGYGLSPDAWLVIMDRTNDGASSPSVYGSNAEGLVWAAEQQWIDIIHTNIQNPVPLAREETATPLLSFEGYPDEVLYALEKGKLVVSAGGNFYALPTETSPHAGPPGVLVAGASDNCGYADFSNPNPHVVMDGYLTVSAAPSGYDNATFGGTSSASPRVSGYVAELLLQVRGHFNDTQGMRDGVLLVIDDETKWPEHGPLSDGRLTNEELAQVVRNTADPNPHDSKWDGDPSPAGCIPQPVDLPHAFYPKMGYGKLSEHTFPLALEVLLGEAPLPDRPVEDAFFFGSETARATFWETV